MSGEMVYKERESDGAQNDIWVEMDVKERLPDSVKVINQSESSGNMYLE